MAGWRGGWGAEGGCVRGRERNGAGGREGDDVNWGGHAEACVEAPASAAAQTVRKAVMHDIPPILALING